MTNEDLVLDEFKKLVGQQMEPEVWEAGREHIKWFAQAIGDPNPLWQDKAYAEKSRYKNIIAPPLFLIDSGLVKLVGRLVDMAPHLANINGGTEIEYFRPIEAGDTITTVAKLADAQLKTGKTGSLIFLVFEVTYTNQRGELVAILRNTFVRR
jgi:acyl dehydratase